MTDRLKIRSYDFICKRCNHLLKSSVTSACFDLPSALKVVSYISSYIFYISNVHDRNFCEPSSPMICIYFCGLTSYKVLIISSVFFSSVYSTGFSRYPSAWIPKASIAYSVVDEVYMTIVSSPFLRISRARLIPSRFGITISGIRDYIVSVPLTLYHRFIKKRTPCVKE